MPTISSRPITPALPLIPSTYQIGDIVLFAPLALMKGPQWTVLARVERVSFDIGKVLYDLAIEEDHAPGAQSNSFYDVYPLCNVDSVFVLGKP